MSEEGAWRLMAAETPETVLFADDNADMREYVSRLLKSRYWVTTALNGREALSKALATAPDLVLVDVMMPETDGFELVQSLRSQPSTKNVRPNKTKGRPDFRAKRRFNAYSDGVVENHKKTVQSVAWIGSLTSYRFDQGIAGY
jgi:response regulator RpfG family c-di-GMP phosphodiesterase